MTTLDPDPTTGLPDLTAGVFDPDGEPTLPELGVGAERVCKLPGCGKDISHRHHLAEYCSDEHRETARNQRRAKTDTTQVSSPARRGKNEGKFPMGAALWGGLGYLMQMRVAEPVGPPVGRVMQFQAGDAGPRVERIGRSVGGEITKRLPFLKTIKKGGQFAEDVTALALPPLLTAALATGRVPAAVAEPLFYVLLRPLVADVLRQSKEAAATITEMSDADREIHEATRDLLASIFGPALPEQHPEG